MGEKSAGVREAFVQALAGGCAAGISSLVFHPLDLVKTRLNKGSDEDGRPYKHATDVIVRQYRKGGISRFYDGVKVKILQDVVRCLAFFYVFTTLKRAYRRRFGKIPMAANLLLGYLAATFNLAISMPVEVANTRMITGLSTKGLLSTWSEIVRLRGNRTNFSQTPSRWHLLPLRLNMIGMFVCRSEGSVHWVHIQSNPMSKSRHQAYGFRQGTETSHDCCWPDLLMCAVWFANSGRRLCGTGAFWAAAGQEGSLGGGGLLARSGRNRSSHHCHLPIHPRASASSNLPRAAAGAQARGPDSQ